MSDVGRWLVTALAVLAAVAAMIAASRARRWRIEAERLLLRPERPTAQEEGEPHLFHFFVTVQGHLDNWTGEPFKLTVRAWNLQEACARAAEVPLPEWTMPPEDDAPAFREDPWVCCETRTADCPDPVCPARMIKP